MQRLCLLVCGSHRCGTSAVTRTINLLGADIARDLMPATFDNVRGYWESAAVVKIHDDLLNSLRSHADPFDPLPLPSLWQDAGPAQRAKHRLINLIETEFADSDLFVVKDPRISRLLPLWTDVLRALSIDPIIVIPFRNPLEVATSLSQRDALPLSKALLLYLQSYMETELASRSLPRIFVRYDSFLRDWRFFQHYLNEVSSMRFSMPSPLVQTRIDEFLTTDLYHHRFSREQLLNVKEAPLTLVQLFDEMCNSADTRDDGPLRVSSDHFHAACKQIGQLYRAFVVADREALHMSFDVERELLKGAFEHSTSWRITAPLRWVKRKYLGFGPSVGFLGPVSPRGSSSLRPC
jgi:hypothetical protein